MNTAALSAACCNAKGQNRVLGIIPAEESQTTKHKSAAPIQHHWQQLCLVQDQYSFTSLPVKRQRGRTGTASSLYLKGTPLKCCLAASTSSL